MAVAQEVAGKAEVTAGEVVEACNRCCLPGRRRREAVKAAEAMAAAEMAAAAAAAALLRRTDIGQQYNSFERQVLVVVVAAAVVTVRGRRQGASWWRWRWRRRRRWWWRWRFHIRLTPCAASARTPCARWIAAFAPRDDHVESVERTRGMCMYPFRRSADCFIPFQSCFVNTLGRETPE